MGPSFKLAVLLVSFLLYLVDLVLDVYVAIRHLGNGDELFFGITVAVVILSIILVNIYATTVLTRTSRNVRRFLCVCHFSMIYLFVDEIVRWVKENRGENAHPCGGEKHFSACNCDECVKRLKISALATLEMSHTRSMETFIESVPQFLLQVYIMVYKNSYPWYTIVSVAFSFVTLVFSVYMLERNYWINKTVKNHPEYLRPITFSNISAIFFILWQSCLLFARLSAIVLNIIVFSGSIGIIICVHWVVVMLALLCSVASCESFRGFCFKFLTVFSVSFVIIYPLLFHVSRSTVACLKKFIPGIDNISKKLKTIALVLVPFLFLVFHVVGGVVAIVMQGRDELLGWYLGIGVMYVVAFVFEVIYYTCSRLTDKELDMQTRTHTDATSHYTNFEN